MTFMLFSDAKSAEEYRKSEFKMLKERIKDHVNERNDEICEGCAEGEPLDLKMYRFCTVFWC